MRSTRHSSRSVLLFAFAALAPTFSACGGEPQLTVILHAAEGVFTPDNLKFQFAKLEDPPDTKPDEVGPFPTATPPDNLFETVPPESQFSIDVMGCPTTNADDCIDPGSFQARGCTDHFISVARDDNQKVDITLHNALDGAAICPTPRP